MPVPKLMNPSLSLLAICALALAVSPAVAAEKIWFGGSSDWSNPAAWTPAGVPGPDDVVTVTGGTIGFAAPVTLGNRLILTGGVLAGGTLIIAPEAEVVVEGEVGVRLVALQLQNSGVLRLRGPGALVGLATGHSQFVQITNLPSGQILIEGDELLYSSNPSGWSGFRVRLDNAGIVRKSAGPGTTTWSGVVLQNDGLLDVTSGNLALPSGGNSAGGEFRASEGSEIRFLGGAHQWAPARFTGPGSTRIVGPITATGEVLGDRLQVAAGGSWTGDVTNTGRVTVTGGALVGGRWINSPSGILDLDLTSDLVLIHERIDNAGLIQWRGTANVVPFASGHSQSVVVSNLTSGRVLLTGSGSWLPSNPSGWSGFTIRWDQAGWMEREGSDGTWLYAGGSYLAHPGSVHRVSSGRLQFPGGFVSSGRWEIGSAARVEATGGGLALQEGHEATGAGFFGIPGGTVGVTGLSRGMLHLAGGHLAGLALTNASGSRLIISNETVLTLSTSRLVNEGMLEWSGAGDVVVLSTGNNQHNDLIQTTTGTLIASTDRGWVSANPSGWSGTDNRWVNAGLIRKERSTGTNPISGIRIDNHGLIDASTGALLMNGGGGASGEFRTGDDAAILLSGGSCQWNQARFSGTGRTRVIGSLSLNGSTLGTNLVFESGSQISGSLTNFGRWTWRGGVWSGGNVVVSPGAELYLDLVEDLRWIAFTVENHGRIVWAGPHDLVAQAGGNNQAVRVVNGPGAAFELVDTGNFRAFNPVGWSGFRVELENQGLLVRSTPGSTGFNGVRVLNPGQVQALAGHLIFDTGGEAAGGEFVAAAGGLVQFTGGSWLWPDTRFTGDGRKEITGNLSITGEIHSTQLHVLPTAAWNGSALVHGEVFVHGGILAGGTWQIAPDGILHLQTEAPVRMRRLVVLNQGITRWSGVGDLIGEADGNSQTVLWTNSPGSHCFLSGSGRWTTLNPVGWSGFRVGLDHAGSLTREGNPDATTWSGVVVVHHPGSTVHLASGRMVHSDNLRSSGSWTLDAGTRVEMMGGEVRLDLGHVTQGEGFFGIVGGVTRLVGVNRGPLHWTGGTLVNSAFTNLPDGQFVLTNGTSLTFQSSAFVNEGRMRIQLRDGLTAMATGNNQLLSVSNAANAELVLEGGFPLTAFNGVGWSGFRVVLANDGLLRRIGSNTTNRLAGVELRNDGLVSVDSGVLQIAANGTCDEGEFRQGDGALLSFQQGSHLWSHARFTGAGVAWIDGAIACSGSVHSRELHLRPGGSVSGSLQHAGRLVADGGTWSSGTLTIPAEGEFQLADGASFLVTVFDLQNQGRMSWGANSRITAMASGNSQSIRFVTWPGASWSSGSGSTLVPANGVGWSGFSVECVNAGSWSLPGGADPVSLGVSVENQGQLDLGTGRLECAAFRATSSSSLTLEAVASASPALKVTGLLALDGRLAARRSIVPLIAGATRRFAEANPRQGTFLNPRAYIPGSGLDFAVSYGPQSVDLLAGNAAPSEVIPGSIAIDSDGLRFSIPANPESEYLTEISADLLNWAPLSVSRPEGPVLTLLHPGGGTNDWAFYRVFQLP